MINIQRVNYLRTHRRRSGLSQDELVFLLSGYGKAKVARYERDLRVPSLENLMAYELIFRQNLAGLFPGVVKRLIPTIKQRACKLKKKLVSLKNQSASNRQKIEFLNPLCDERGQADSDFLPCDFDAECGSRQVMARFAKVGQPVWAGESRLLAIDPTSRGFGFAIAEQNPSFLLDWGVANCRDYLKIDCLDRIEKMIGYFQPTDLLVEDSCPIPRSRCHKLRQFIRKLKAVAQKHSLTVHVLPSATVRAAFAAEGARNQEERAA